MSDLVAFAERGWAVVEAALTGDECRTLLAAHRELVGRLAVELGVPNDTAMARLAQTRDLWRQRREYDELMRGPLARLAMAYLGTRGARLLHDHMIVKPAGRSGTVPWHQDYPYWPIDSSGISLWLALEDAPLHGGCLEVVEGSHHGGEAPPVDFLRGEAPPIDERCARTLPVARGSIVILDGLIWHLSRPNESAGTRAAYISLWVPADATYAPEHAPWHPTNANMTVRPGELPNEDWFPSVGEVPATGEARPVLAHAGSTSGPSMFTASKTVLGQLRALLGDVATNAGLEELAALHADRIIDELMRRGVVERTDGPRLREVLDDLVLTSRAYRLRRARDVYLSAYRDWWALAGRALEEDR